MTRIKAEIVADSLSPQGDRLTSLLITFPRIILAEVNTHRMLSKNTSSSRAIPFSKMVESVSNDPFIPIAWQKDHKGMQGTEYVEEPYEIENRRHAWIASSYEAIKHSQWLNNLNVTKQLCNRLLEPFMWTTMLITGSKEGWDNFFKLRCPVYEWEYEEGTIKSKSKEEFLEMFINRYPTNGEKELHDWEAVDEHFDPVDSSFWRSINKGHAEIHMMALAEAIYDAMRESTPKQLQVGRWHIPFEYTIDLSHSSFDKFKYEERGLTENEMNLLKVKISTAMAARTSYTVVGNEKEVSYERMAELHDRLIAQDPPHSSPMEHCARAMSEEEYMSFVKGESVSEKGARNRFTNRHYGWCNNFKGFIQYRYLIENHYNGK